MGQAFLKARLPSTAALLLACLYGSPSLSAGLDGPGQSELRRAFLAASLSTSEEPAVRAERRDARATGLNLAPKTVLQLAAVPEADLVLARWLTRRAGPDQDCR